MRHVGIGISSLVRFGAVLNPTEPEGNAPTDISLSSVAIDEFEPVGSIVGAFSTTDADVGDTFTYSLVAGTGDTDNASFTIDSANLKTAEVFDVLFPTEKSSYAIRVRSTDAGGLSTEKAFTITINQIQPAKNTVDLLDEGLPTSNIDYRLIHLATLGLTGQVIDIRGNDARTSASDDAVETLTITQDNQVWEDL